MFLDSSITGQAVSMGTQRLVECRRWPWFCVHHHPLGSQTKADSQLTSFSFTLAGVNTLDILLLLKPVQVVVAVGLFLEPRNNWSCQFTASEEVPDEQQTWLCWEIWVDTKENPCPPRQTAEHTMKLAKKAIVAVSEFSHDLIYHIFIPFLLRILTGWWYRYHLYKKIPNRGFGGGAKN